MLNLTKRLNFRIVSLAVAVSLFFTGTVYGIDLTKGTLRVPLSMSSESFTDRNKNALDFFVSPEKKVVTSIQPSPYKLGEYRKRQREERNIDKPIDPEKIARHDKFDEHGKPILFYGLTCIAWARSGTGLYEKLCRLKEDIKIALEEAGMGNVIAWTDEPSYHMTICDIDPSDKYDCAQKGVTVPQYQERLEAVDKAYRRIGSPGSVSAIARHIGLKATLGINVDFPNAEELEKVLEMEGIIKEETGVSVREYSGHLTLGYLVNMPKDADRFRQILKEKYKEANLGKFVIQEFDLTYFYDMNSFIPILTKDLKSGEVISSTNKEIIATILALKDREKLTDLHLKVLLNSLLSWKSIEEYIYFNKAPPKGMINQTCLGNIIDSTFKATSILRNKFIAANGNITQDLIRDTKNIIPKLLFLEGIKFYNRYEGSKATRQQALVEYLKFNPEIFEATLEVLNKNKSSLDNIDKGWLELLMKIHNKEIQKFVRVIPAEDSEVYVSIDEEKNTRTKFDHVSKLFYQDGEAWQGFYDKWKHIDEHVESLWSQLEGKDYIVIPYGNLLFNSYFVLFKDGDIYHRDGEFDSEGNAINNRTYTCFISWKDGRKTIDRLIFKKGINGEKDKVYLSSQLDKDISTDISIAIYGQQIVNNSRPVDLVGLVKEFDDINQLLRFPVEDNGKEYTFSEVHSDGSRFKLAELLERGIGERAKYSHSLIGLTEKGEIIMAALAGDRKEGIGVTIEEAADFLIQNGAKDAILLSNGGDVNLRYNDNLITESPFGTQGGVRTIYPSVIGIAIKKLSIQQKETMTMVRRPVDAPPAKSIFVSPKKKAVTTIQPSPFGMADGGAVAWVDEGDFDGFLKSEWDIRMEKGEIFLYNLDGLRRRPVGRFWVQFNPGKAEVLKRRGSPKVDTNSVYREFNDEEENFIKIYSKSPRYRLFDVNIASQKVTVALTHRPALRHHFLLLPFLEKKCPQFLTEEALKVGLEIFRLTKDSTLKIGFNSLGANASINHLHFQGIYYPASERNPEGRLPIEIAEKMLFETLVGVNIYRLSDWPARTLMFEGDNEDDLANITMQYVALLQENNIPHSVIITKGRVYVVPRARAKSKICIGGLGFMEVAGEIYQSDETGYEELNENYIDEDLENNSLSEDIIEHIDNIYFKLLGKAGNMSSSKSQIDEVADTIDPSVRLELIDLLEDLIDKLGFRNLSVRLRYLYITLLAYRDNCAFVDVVRKLIPGLIEKCDYRDFNNMVRFTGFPRILLIGPYKAGDLKIGQFLAPPLGCYRTASFLRLFGIEADVYDTDLDGLDRLEQLLRERQYDIVGFSCLQPTLHNDMNLMWHVRKILPEAFIIAGGQGAAFNQDILFSSSPASVVVRGWGEFPMLEMALNWDSDSSPESQLADIRGLYIKTDGHYLTTGYAKHYTSDDLRSVSLTQDFSMIPYERYWDCMRGVYSDEHLKIMQNEKFLYTIRLYTESHCPMGCDFCSSTHLLDDAIGRRQRVLTLSAQDILTIIELARKVHPEVRAFYLNDDNFMLNRHRIVELCDLLTKRFKKGEIYLFCLSRVDNVDKEILIKMKEAGFEMIVYGVESFSERILDHMDKSVRIRNGLTQGELAERTVRWTLEAGLIARINLILFYPTVTLDDLRFTIDKSVDLTLEGAIFDPFTFVEAYAGANILKKGYKVKTQTHKIGDEALDLEIPESIELEDEQMARIAEGAFSLKPAIDEEIKRIYNWEGKLPAPVNSLTQFKAIYISAGLETTRIDDAIDKLMRKTSRKPTRRVYVATSIGGTKLGLGLFEGTNLLSLRNWEWESELKRKGDDTSSHSLFEFIAEKIVETFREMDISPSDIIKIGISWPGPYDGVMATSSYFSDEGSIAIMPRMTQVLKRVLGCSLEVEIIPENKAQVIGEHNMPEGGLYNRESGCVLNLATGIGIGVLEKGEFIDRGVCRIAGRDFKIETGLSHLGRHLIRRSDGSWEYRPTVDGQVPPMLGSEERFTKIFGGHALALNFIDRAIHLKGEDVREYIDLPQSLGVIKEILVSSAPDDIVRVILGRINALGKEGDPLAIEFIKDTGLQIGNALKVFFNAYKGYHFGECLVITGGVGLNFGREVVLDDKGEDIFIRGIKQGSGISNVYHSKIGLKAELSAFISDVDLEIERLRRNPTIETYQSVFKGTGFSQNCEEINITMSQPDGGLSQERLFVKRDFLTEPNIYYLASFIASLINIQGEFSGVNGVEITSSSSVDVCYLLNKVQIILYREFKGTVRKANFGKPIIFGKIPDVEANSGKEHVLKVAPLSSISQKALGVDIGAGYLKLIAIEGNRVIKERIIPQKELAGPELDHNLEKALDDFSAEVGIEWKAVRSLIVAVPGLVDLEGDIVIMPNLESQYPGSTNALKRFREKHQIVFKNDAKVAAAYISSGFGLKGTIVVNTLGTGLGVAAIKERQILPGILEGHIRVDFSTDSPKHTCGTLGCLEDVTNSSFVIRRARELSGRGDIEEAEQVAIWLDGSGEERELAQSIFRELGKNLGILYRELSRFLDAESLNVVLIGGLVKGKATQFIIDGIKEETARWNLKINVFTEDDLKSTSNKGFFDDVSSQFQVAVGAALLSLSANQDKIQLLSDDEVIKEIENTMGAKIERIRDISASQELNSAI